MTDGKGMCLPGADALRAMRSVFCALDMLHDDVCTPQGSLPKHVGMAMTDTKDTSALEVEIYKYVEGLIVLSEEYRGMTVNLMREISKALNIPFENEIPLKDALDSRASFKHRMEEASGETAEIEKMLDVLRTDIEEEERRKS